MRLSKNEDAPKKWEKKLYKEGKDSARCMPIGHVLKRTNKWKVPYRLELAEKFIMRINFCPHCKSKNTYHKRVQMNGDKVGNVWLMERWGELKHDSSYGTKKWDFCFNCGSQFLIEMFAFVCKNRIRHFFEKLKEETAKALEYQDQYYKDHPDEGMFGMDDYFGGR